MARALPPGRHDVGGGLWLNRVSDTVAHWEMDLTLEGRPEALLIGDFPKMSVKAARREATRLKGLARRGLDPAAEQERLRNAAARNLHQFYC